MSKNDAGWPPSEGTSGVADVPVTPWQARQGASRSASGSGRAAPGAPKRSARARSNGGRAERLRPARVAPAARLPSAAMAHAVDRAVVVVGDEERAVLHYLHVDRARDVFVVLEETGQERLDRLHAAIRVELRDHDVAADLLGAVPRPVPGDEDRVLVLGREHVACIETHAEGGGMGPEQRDRRLVVVAGMTPAMFRVGEIALVAERIAEVLLARCGDAVELVLRHVLRDPVAAIVGEVELLRRRVPVETDGVAHALHDHFHAAAVEIHATDMGIGLRVRVVDVARRADRASGPMAMNFQPCGSSLGKLSLTSVGFGGLSRW